MFGGSAKRLVVSLKFFIICFCVRTTACSGKRLCAFCRAVWPPIYIQYYFRPTRHVSPSHIHLSTPSRRPFHPRPSAILLGSRILHLNIQLTCAQRIAQLTAYSVTTLRTSFRNKLCFRACFHEALQRSVQ